MNFKYIFKVTVSIVLSVLAIIYDITFNISKGFLFSK